MKASTIKLMLSVKEHGTGGFKTQRNLKGYWEKVTRVM